MPGPALPETLLEVLALALSAGFAASGGRASQDSPPAPTAAPLRVSRIPRDDLLLRVSAALGTRDRARNGRVRLEGDADFYGIPCRFRLSLDGDGAFEQAVDGPLGETVGSDGDHSWMIDRTGAPRLLSFEDAEKWRAIADLLTSRWIDDPSTPPEVREDGPVRVELPSGMTEEIWIDPSTSLPSRGTFDLHSGQVVVALSDWRSVGSRKLPFCYRITEGGLTDSFKAQEVSEPSKEEEPPKMPAFVRPDDSIFDHDASSEIEVRPSPIHLLLVHPLLNGRDVGWFILDTGAEVMCIDPTVADQLEMPRMGRLPLTGVGGTVTSAFRRAEEFQLGPLTLQRPFFCELDFTPVLPVLKERVAGIVGYDYLYRAIVSIDVAGPAVKVFDPATYHLEGAGWEKVRYSSGNPAVQADFEGDRCGWFLLDTGDPSSVIFFTGYVNEQHLLDGRQTTAANSTGVGGTISSRSGEVEWFRLGDHVFESLGVLFARGTSGTYTTRGLAGNIGQGLMRPFRIVFDLGGARVAFVPRD